MPLLQPCSSLLPLHAAHEPPQVLVYDDAGEHAVCPLFKIAQLRALGVTVFYNLNGTRERGPVPDAVPTMPWHSLGEPVGAVPATDVSLVCGQASLNPLFKRDFIDRPDQYML